MKLRGIAAIAAIATLTACGSSGHAVKRTPEQQYLVEFNSQADSVGGPHATSSSDKDSALAEGRAFCASFKQTGDLDKAKQAIVDTGTPDNLAGVIMLAATKSGSLCPA